MKRVPRRKFLEVSLKAAAALPFLPACAVAPKREDDPLLILPGDPRYEKGYAPHNARFADQRPVGIFQVSDESEVIHALEYCRENRAPVHVRGGGHCFEDFSTGPGIVLDLAELNEVEVLPELNEAWVEGGTRSGKLIAAAAEHGLVLPTGNCPSVGIAGLTLGGGYGFLARKLGLTSDCLRAVEMITFDGRKLVADANQNTDLLWACRGGGGGNLGVVTRFGYALRRPSSEFTAITMPLRRNRLAKMIGEWQSLAPAAPDELTTLLYVETGKTGVSFATLLGLYTGKKSRALRALDPLVRLQCHSDLKLTEGPYAEAAEVLGGAFDAELKPQAFKARFDYFMKPIPKEGIQNLEALISAPVDGSVSLTFGAWQGAIARVGKQETAFVHRDALFSIKYGAAWQDSSLNRMDAFYIAMRPYASGFSYVNYPDRDLKDWKRSYYGENRERLAEIKEKYDPSRGFRFAQDLGV